MGGFVDVGLPFDLNGGWELGAAQVCGEELAVGGKVEVRSWFERDAQGRLVREVRAVPDRAPDQVQSVTYDAAGRVARIEVSRRTSGKLHLDYTTEYVRDPSGRVTSVRTEQWSRSFATDDPDLDTWKSTVSESAWTWSRGRVVRHDGGMGAFMDFEYDAAGHLLSESSTYKTFPTLGDPGGQTIHEVASTLVWAADGRSVAQTLISSRGNIEVTWALDADGVPLQNSARVSGPTPEVVTWLRDCSSMPQVPRP